MRLVVSSSGWQIVLWHFVLLPINFFHQEAGHFSLIAIFECVDRERVPLSILIDITFLKVLSIWLYLNGVMFSSKTTNVKSQVALAYIMSGHVILRITACLVFLKPACGMVLASQAVIGWRGGVSHCFKKYPLLLFILSRSRPRWNGAIHQMACTAEWLVVSSLSSTLAMSRLALSEGRDASVRLWCGPS